MKDTKQSFVYTFADKEVSHVEGDLGCWWRVWNARPRPLKCIFLWVPLCPINWVIVSCRELWEGVLVKTVPSSLLWTCADVKIITTFHCGHKLYIPVRVCAENFVKLLQHLVCVIGLKERQTLASRHPIKPHPCFLFACMICCGVMLVTEPISHQNIHE